MKQLDHEDADNFALGKPIRPEPEGAKPQLRQVDGAAKGVLVGPDGRLQTEIPLPPSK